MVMRIDTHYLRFPITGLQDPELSFKDLNTHEKTRVPGTRLALENSGRIQIEHPKRGWRFNSPGGWLLPAVDNYVRMFVLNPISGVLRLTIRCLGRVHTLSRAAQALGRAMQLSQATPSGEVANSFTQE